MPKTPKPAHITVNAPEQTKPAPPHELHPFRCQDHIQWVDRQVIGLTRPLLFVDEKKYHLRKKEWLKTHSAMLEPNPSFAR